MPRVVSPTWGFSFKNSRDSTPHVDFLQEFRTDVLGTFVLFQSTVRELLRLLEESRLPLSPSGSRSSTG